jgi:gluconokinase
LFAYVVDDERLVIGGAISNAGNLREWCLRELRLEGDLDKTLGRSASAANNLIVLPHLVSERAPTWPENVLGTFAGLTHVTSAADIYRAVTTATYYRLADILEALPPAEEIIVSGGVLKSKASLEILADCLGRDIHVCRELESSLRGAAIFALTKLGYKVPPIRAGKLVRHNPALAEKHRARRGKQRALERLFGG